MTANSNQPQQIVHQVIFNHILTCLLKMYCWKGRHEIHAFSFPSAMESADFKLTHWSVMQVISSSRGILNAHTFIFQLISFKSFFYLLKIFFINWENVFKRLKPIYIHFFMECNKLSGHLEATWIIVRRQVHGIKWIKLHERRLTRTISDMQYKFAES